MRSFQDHSLTYKLIYELDTPVKIMLSYQLAINQQISHQMIMWHDAAALKACPHELHFPSEGHTKFMSSTSKLSQYNSNVTNRK